MKSETLEAVSSVASKATYGGAGTSVIGWLLSSQGSVLIGILVAVIGLIVNLVCRIREEKRRTQRHEAYMRRLAEVPGGAPLEDLGEDD
jgi:hypothetical protein